ncbi:MAG: ATP-binding protein [Albidovulum sp.]|nr:ATP-binding protein [Albidovulum sp.]
MWIFGGMNYFSTLSPAIYQFRLSAGGAWQGVASDLELTDNEIWSSLPFPALIVDERDAVEDMNPAAEAVLNSSSRQMAGRDVAECLFVDEEAREGLRRARTGSVAVSMNDVRIRAGGRNPIPVSVQIAHIHALPGKMLLCMQSREMVNRMNPGKRMNTAANSAVGMAAMLTHEIKNPLAGISGAAQLLSMGLDRERRELTDLIFAETRRILSLLENVEQFGDYGLPDAKAMNIHDTLEKARKLALMGFAAGATIRCEFDPSLPFARADSDQLLQALLNLLKNAVESAGSEGSIVIRTYFDSQLSVSAEDGTKKTLPIQVEIIDSGPGLPAHIADHVFEPFVSGKENGTGLGLALVSKIISDHGGWISLDSKPGRMAVRLSLEAAD